MFGLRKILLSVLLMMAACFFLIAVVFSSQRDDFLHSATFLDGLIKHGLTYYDQSRYFLRLGGSDYLPGLYGLLQAAILPAQVLEVVFHLDRCTYLARSPIVPCLLETLSLKAFTAFLALVWVVLLQKSLRLAAGRQGLYPGDSSLWQVSWRKAVKPTLYLLFFPPILYATFLFGSYDGLGAFVTLIGGLLYFNSSLLVGHGSRRQALLRFCGLVLASIGVSAKFFPFILLLGTCIAFSRSWKDSFLGTGVPLMLTAGQIWVTQQSGGHPIRILGNKITEQTSSLLYPRAAGLLLLFLYLLLLIYACSLSRNRLAIASLVVLGVFSLLFPSIHWHSQWQLYYGISLACSYAIIGPKGRSDVVLLALFTLQSVAFILITPFFADNADITMAFSTVSRELVPSFVATNILPDPLGRSMQLGWIIYGATQVAILITFTALFLRSVKTGASAQAAPGANSFCQVVHLVPGVVFLFSWYSFVFASMIKVG